MRKVITTLLAVMTALTSLAQTAYTHPGLDLSLADLDRIKSKVAAKEKPWIDGWNKMIAENDAQSTFKPSPKPTVGGSDGTRQRASRDALAAYYNILRWYVTGSEANAQCAVRILNAWARSISEVVTGELFMLPIPEFMRAAELTRLYSGWSISDQETFANMVRNYFYPACRDYRNYSGTWPGWGGPANYCCLAIGIYLDEEKMVSEAIENFKSGTGGGCINNGILPSGQCEEMGRDQPHAEIGLSSYADFCQAAWLQGIDLYAYGDNRLLRGFEYFCRFNLDHASETVWDPISYGGHNFYYPANNNNSPESMPQNRIYSGTSFQMVYHHYTEHKQMAAPNLRAMINLVPQSVLRGTLWATEDTTTVYTAQAKPSTPVGLTAEAGENRIYLDWQAAERDRANGYVIQRSTCETTGFTTLATFTANCTTEYIDKTAETGTTYYYRVAAKNQSGTSAYSAPVSAAAVGAQSQLPIGWAQTDIGDVSLKGSTLWADVQGGSWVVNGSGVDNWNGRQPIGNFTYTMVAGDFDIQMRIYDCLQKASEIKVKVGLATFASLATSSRSVFMQLGGTGTRGTSLCWRASDGESMQQVAGSDHTWHPVWYRLQRNDNTFTGLVSSDGQTWQQVGTCTVSLPANAYVGLFVCGGATNPAGFTASFDHLKLTSVTVAPTAPVSLKVTAQNSTTIKLTWSKSATAITYNVSRSTMADGNYETVAQGISTLYYTDSDLQPNTTYYYKVSAANAGGESEQTDAVSATTADLQLPKSPAGLKPTVKNNRVLLTWKAVAEQTEIYNIYRRIGAAPDGFSSELIGTSTNASYEDRTAENDTVYYYRVAAVNALGEGALSMSVKAMPTLGWTTYLPMNEDGGTTLTNVLTNKQGGTLSDKITWVSGKYDRGLGLTATNNCVARLTNGIVGGFSDFTISVWVKPTTLSKWARAWDFGTGTSEYMFLSIHSDKGRPKFGIKHAGSEESVEGASSLSVGSWSHLVVTLQDSLCTLYVNGKAVATNKTMTNRPSMLGITTQNYLGQSQWSGDSYYTGSIDEFRLYSQALTAEQVKQLYRAKRQIIAMDETMEVCVDSPVLYPATSNSNLPVALTSSKTSVVRAIADSLVIRNIGETVITATQTGNLDWSAAMPKTMTLIVSESTGTEGIVSETDDESTPFCTISGIRVPNGKVLLPGLYIRGRKKIVVK